MYKWDNKYTNEIYRILCGECYRGCQQSPYMGCELHREQQSPPSEGDSSGGEDKDPGLEPGAEGSGKEDGEN